MNLSDYPEVLKFNEMCEIYRCSRPALRRRWEKGELPKPIQVGREHIWPRWTIEEHLGKKPVEQSPESSIEQIREQVRKEIAAEVTPLLSALTRALCKGVPNHAST